MYVFVYCCVCSLMLRGDLVRAFTYRAVYEERAERNYTQQHRTGGPYNLRSEPEQREEAHHEKCGIRNRACMRFSSPKYTRGVNTHKHGR